MYYLGKSTERCLCCFASGFDIYIFLPEDKYIFTGLYYERCFSWCFPILKIGWWWSVKLLFLIKEQGIGQKSWNLLFALWELRRSGEERLFKNNKNKWKKETFIKAFVKLHCSVLRLSCFELSNHARSSVFILFLLGIQNRACQQTNIQSFDAANWSAFSN